MTRAIKLLHDTMSGSHFIAKTNKFMLIHTTAVTLGQRHEKVI